MMVVPAFLRLSALLAAPAFAALPAAAQMEGVWAYSAAESFATIVDGDSRLLLVCNQTSDGFTVVYDLPKAAVDTAIQGIRDLVLIFTTDERPGAPVVQSYLATAVEAGDRVRIGFRGPPTIDLIRRIGAAGSIVGVDVARRGTGSDLTRYQSTVFPAIGAASVTEDLRRSCRY